MTQDEVLAIFRDCGALLEGHFILSSGLRSPVFLQKQRVFMYPEKAEILCRALADDLRAAGYGNVSKIVSPAIGGIIPGYETARHLGVPSIFTERVDGKFQLRRGFEVAPGERVLVVEDIVTTGLSIRECIDCLREAGADPGLLDALKKLRSEAAAHVMANQAVRAQGAKELNAGLSGLRDWLNDLMATNPQGKFWDPAQEIRKQIQGF